MTPDLLDLASNYVTLKKVSAHRGGEWAGPCPLCGGVDRFRVNPYAERPIWWCRQCNRSGDTIQLVREVEGVGYREALRLLGLAEEDRVTAPPRAPAPPEPPAWPALEDDAWQAAAQAYADSAADCLHSAVGRRARAYLHGRGLTPSVIAAHEIGYTPRPFRAYWGKTEVYLPAGLVLPWRAAIEGRIWKVRTRALGDVPRDRKWSLARGSANGLYGVAFWVPGRDALLVEGELDALSVWSAAPGQVNALATGGVSGARLPDWIARLATAPRVLLAFDDDEAGDAAAAWWHDVLPDAVRLRPTRKDVNAMLQAGDDLAAWLAGEAVQGVTP